MSLMQELGQRALDRGVPLGVQLDVTYRCNERCVHCYLDHDDHGEMTTAEIRGVLDQVAEAGRFLPYPERRRSFHAQGFLRHPRVRPLADVLREDQDQRLHDPGKRSANACATSAVKDVQVSIYSHRPEVHDAITSCRVRSSGPSRGYACCAHTA